MEGVKLSFDPFEFLEKEREVKQKWFISEDKLDDSQYNILYAQDDDYLIEGCAGSGKTILALHRLIKFIESGKDTVLFVIFTKVLKTFIQSGVEANLFDKDTVEICYSHEVLTKIENGEIGYYDYIIIDEVQDLKENVIQSLVGVCSKHIILFGDDKQQIYVSINNGITLKKIRRITGIPSENHLYLEKNYRLPRLIAEFAGKIIEDNGELYNRCVKGNGLKPIIFKFNSEEDEIREIIKIITDENLTDVGILFPNNNLIKFAKQMFENEGFFIEYKYQDKRFKKTYNTLDFNSDLPKLITYHSSKGLEFETVFLPSCSIDSECYNYREALYVACTRPTKKLYVSYVDELSPYIDVK